MSRPWLQRKRKAELIELAQLARIPNADGYLKDDLVTVLEERLDHNESKFGRIAELSDYYSKTRIGSPVKRELRSSPSESLAAAKTRRRTLVKTPEPTPVETVHAVKAAAPLPPAVTRTPLNFPPPPLDLPTPQIDFPASPADLASVADQTFRAASTKATELWSRTRIDQAKELIRESASSVSSIQTLILLIEAIGLQYNTLQVFNLAPTPDTLLSVPDGWRLLTSDWWAPATLWSLTSWILPLIASYFFNLTLRANTMRRSAEREYPADPLTFNIVKAVLAYSAYYRPLVEMAVGGHTAFVRAEGARWGPFSSETVGVVRGNVPGGHAGLQIGAVVGILVSLYDAALKK
ncbi:hypothetical protein P153DRAFT_343658 [Dothidotthia symphoricarpi CBS 119687]|uniref:Uncharacterized protein n=1 Tax=Dothidotthia symphoricarpi CBS 119687 TaxID=1392245 RepID=A0A6A6AA12_9PLEO|nr:uncharacterized protein P153DRAFT_343658 [Dothidotthia symphoricarpi CBS 119687]KAF2127521.1 hypothetical protein P153DRAFT_343658 [Dothidotthia symphoricarpi CBS 119687]